MATSFTRSRTAGALAGAAALTLAVAGCASTDEPGDGDATGTDGATTSSGSDTILIGTTDKITTIDPAGSYDNGSFAVMNQVYPFLLNTPYGSPDVEPDIAESAEFVSPSEYQVVLKEGLTFANGNALTASDVKFTFDRMVGINDVNGPASLLYNLDSVDVVDDLTVVFNLKSENDQVFPQILSSPAGPIVDEDVFAADALTLTRRSWTARPSPGSTPSRRTTSTTSSSTPPSTAIRACSVPLRPRR